VSRILIRNETFADRTKAGRALIFLTCDAQAFHRHELDRHHCRVSIHASAPGCDVKILIQGKEIHEANVSDNPLGTIDSMEKALQGIEHRLTSSEGDLDEYQRKREDLKRHLDKPFEYEENLQSALNRQQEIIAGLDLTKNQASAHMAGESEEQQPKAHAPIDGVTQSESLARNCAVAI
jgi:hypothetical protein